MAGHGGSGARGGRGTARSLGRLAVLLTGIELLAFGIWAVLKGMQIRQEPWQLGVYAAVGGAVGILLWWTVYRDTAAKVEVVRQREHRDRDTRAALLRHARMDPGRLGEHVAELCRRDGLADVAAVRVHDDAHSVDVTGTLPDGTTLAVRCRSAAGAASISGSIVERFTADEHHADHLLVLATTAGGFSQKACDLGAATDNLHLLDRRALARWDLGQELPAPLAAAAAPAEEPAAVKPDDKNAKKQKKAAAQAK
ncbi:restriction endonuclease [Yinghuangia soli]|uniref:Restriction endonuclease n=1 Tax=Yinghuangia soli TaxID=2908204 RepID=A0AA41Q732_9ACTN|nr:restriction endonuclease [Yinghuangia soli]MCF2532773.1 restriction endonuclease [Yinghuangia soli]